MKQKDVIDVVVEVASDGGYCAFSEDVPMVYANGLTETEVKREFLEMMEEQAGYMTESEGGRPWWADAQVRFTYTISTLFATFPFINATALAEWMGINPSLMRKYKAGLAAPRGKNRRIIGEKMAQLSEKLADFAI